MAKNIVIGTVCNNILLVCGRIYVDLLVSDRFRSSAHVSWLLESDNWRVSSITRPLRHGALC